MWFANFIVAASATMVLPFLSLFIETLGDFSAAYVQQWSGYVFGVTFFVAFLMAPFWGRFGDRHGFKKILLITGLGIALSIFFMGFVHSVEQLFFLRLVMGVVTGFIPTSIALISKQTPKEIAGKVLGTLQMGTVCGGLSGPLIGGALADAVGFSFTFILTSITISLATLLVAVGIKEVKLEKEENNADPLTRKEVFMEIMKNPVLLTVMLITLFIQVANFGIQPLLALYVDELTTSSNVAFLAGLAFSATGLGNFIATRQWGKLGDRIGHEKVLLFLLVIASILFIPQALATELWQLVLFRFLFGIALGGMIPCTTAYVRQVAPYNVQGEVLGYNQSFRFLGNVVGPVTGGFIGSYFGFTTVFYITSIIFIANAIALWLSVQNSLQKKTMKSNVNM